MNKRITLLAALCLAFVGGGCAWTTKNEPPPLTSSGQPVAPAPVPTQQPVIPDNAKNIPLPSSR